MCKTSAIEENTVLQNQLSWQWSSVTWIQRPVPLSSPQGHWTRPGDLESRFRICMHRTERASNLPSKAKTPMIKAAVGSATAQYVQKRTFPGPYGSLILKMPVIKVRGIKAMAISVKRRTSSTCEIDLWESISWTSVVIIGFNASRKRECCTICLRDIWYPLWAVSKSMIRLIRLIRLQFVNWIENTLF